MSKEFSLEQLQALMQTVHSNEIREFLYENGDTRLRIRGKREPVVHSMFQSGVSDGPTAIFTTSHLTDSAAAEPVAAAPVAAAPVVKCISSPIVGTYYSASGPDKEPFVKVGQMVHEGDIICIVESMKVMNEVPADKGGVVAEILVENGSPVEYGQALVRLEG